MKGTAIYGDDNGGGEASDYRYVLTREIPPDDPAMVPIAERVPRRVIGERCACARVLFIGLNPSTATADTPDPTITRECGFARSWGFGELWKCNAFGYRTKHPPLMKASADPVGPRNDLHIRDRAARADLIVICWGNDGAFLQRGYYVRSVLLKDFKLFCFGRTQLGEPKHPLYLKADLQPVPW